MLTRTKSNFRRPYSDELNELAGQNVVCSDFKYARGAEIFGEEGKLEYLYQVTSGAVRTYKLLRDGRRQIMAFHLPGDIFGVCNGTTHRFSAEAIIETTVTLTRRQNVFGDFGSAADSTNRVLRLVTQNLQHAETHMLLLGRKSALERVAAFLQEMDLRLTSSGVMRLPMTRRDIADYLGLTVETVSRAVSRLRDSNVLHFVGETHKQIVITDRVRLAEFDQ